ncbi:GxxExxY domain-containing protein [Desulfonema limicola]|uniref:GxxExxY domain-containing protein n=1 Tax=Desulfonema limicola TaxID=45656 RepID=A0A975GF72_9BACT|nr:GxxExxY protein [Desulfonema limicola]QTA78885.1 GxxExxY domain-containing protein [Desulfonema limicola]
MNQLNNPITHTIIGCAMAVHNNLGTGFLEVIYQRALTIEMQMHGLEFLREHKMPIFYHNTKIGSRRVDFLVAQQVMVEIKAVRQMDDIHLAQALNYLKVFNIETGLLINFGGTRLEYKRLFRKE